ncbi:hypothetical protein [Streptomyces sp. MW-W600-10]|uniref:hypothetical protein n=1 Tax=Streptomyces sp. MW-W600-10 TaxID=2829819 RepID=UPI001C45E937|nr:hypothetical protein [Streptomyces sp. MW-W600-10]MBV7244535.1 hypothetical protein [Streptomyces sp. MW-W600-10]
MAAMKRCAARVGAGAGALVVLAGGVFWFGGGYDRWATDRALTTACDGVLPADEVRTALGERRLKAFDDRSEGSLDATTTSLRVTCGISRETGENDGRHVGEGSVTVSVNGVPTLDRESRRYESLYPETGRAALPPAPLGQGWNGVFTTDDSGTDAQATTAVLLDCAPGRGDLLVTVTVDVGKNLGDMPLDNPGRRTAFARIATDTAANASRRWDCDADLGKALKTVPLPVNEDEYVAPADADGTCAGITARGKTVARAWESERGTAPYEKCVLGNAEGDPALTVTAHYGPYAEGAWHDYFERPGAPDPTGTGQRSGILRNGAHWTMADCPDGSGPAFFSVTQYRDEAERTDADRAYALSALKTFAERSARAHSCATPAAPTTSEKDRR